MWVPAPPLDGCASIGDFLDFSEGSGLTSLKAQAFLLCSRRVLHRIVPRTK